MSESLESRLSTARIHKQTLIVRLEELEKDYQKSTDISECYDIKMRMKKLQKEYGSVLEYIKTLRAEINTPQEEKQSHYMEAIRRMDWSLYPFTSTPMGCDSPHNTNVPCKTPSAISTIRAAALSPKETFLRKAGLKDYDGNWSGDARQAFLESMMNGEVGMKVLIELAEKMLDEKFPSAN